MSRPSLSRVKRPTISEPHIGLHAGRKRFGSSLQIPHYTVPYRICLNFDTWIANSVSRQKDITFFLDFDLVQKLCNLEQIALTIYHKKKKLEMDTEGQERFNSVISTLIYV